MTIQLDPASCVLRKGMCVRIGDSDRQWATSAAVDRLRLNIERGTWRPMSDDRGDAIELETIACGAEIAFARMVGVQPVLIKEEWIGQPNGQLPNGTPYNVQHTTLPKGNLLVAYNSHPKREWIFVLCQSHWPDFEFRGWIPGELVLRYRNLYNPKGVRRESWCYRWSRHALRDALTYW